MQVLKTPLVNVYSKNGSLIVHVKMSDAPSHEVLELNPIKEDLQGYIQALTIAQEVLAGKFWPAKTVKVFSDAPKVADIKLIKGE